MINHAAHLSRWRRKRAVIYAALYVHVLQRQSKQRLSSQKFTDGRKRSRHVYERRDYWASTWGVMLSSIRNARACGAPDARGEKTFRLRFRVPYVRFEQLLQYVRDKSTIGPKSSEDAAHRPVAPLELKVLAVLRYLGRGWCLDDLSEASGISGPTLGAFVLDFLQRFPRDHWKEWVHIPRNEEELKQVMEPYDLLGLTGCVGSIDVVHIAMGRCPFSEKNLHVGKEVSSVPCNYLVYHIVVALL